MVDNKIQNMWISFTTFGNIASKFLGVYLVWKIIITTINTKLNILTLYQTFDWNAKVIAGLVSVIIYYIIHIRNNLTFNIYFYYFLIIHLKYLPIKKEQ